MTTIWCLKKVTQKNTQDAMRSFVYFFSFFHLFLYFFFLVYFQDRAVNMKYVEVCKALFDYDARTEEELSIAENDVLYVIEKEDEEWWRAELKQANGHEPGPVGLVPANYLEEVGF
jgi:hypothetical protein